MNGESNHALSTDFECAIFPLNSVLFPQTRMPLRIFEPRYLDMISDSMKQDKPFCITSIAGGDEVGLAAEHHALGCLATVVDWDRLADGQLGIVILGGRRVRIGATRVQADQLRVGQVTLLEEEIEQDKLEGELLQFGELLRRLQKDFSIFSLAPEEQQFMDAAWVSYQLANVLPIDAPTKQSILEQGDALRRLQQIGYWLNEQVYAEQ